MQILQIVPPHFFQERRRQAVYSQGRLQPITIRGLAARILKERGVVYREDWILETVAAWEAVEELLPSLEYFAPIAHYPGFVEEVKWLFSQMDYRELKMDELPKDARPEVEKLYAAYHSRLEQYGVLDSPGQLRRALAALQEGPSEFLAGFPTVELVGLHDLSPLEQELIAEASRGRNVRVLEPEDESFAPTVTAALNPAAEVEELAKAVRRQLEEGISPSQIAVAFPHPRTYLSLLIPTFDKYGIPWNMPGQSLAGLPLGRAVLAFLSGEVEGWHKNNLQLLTAPGWGLPFQLSEANRRRLRLAPPLEGIPAWMEYLGPDEAWKTVLELIREAGQAFPTQPLGAHAQSLQRFLTHFPPERWAAKDILVRAELLKSWDALQLVLENLRAGTSVVNLERFTQLLKSILEDYRINPPRTLADRVAVVAINQLGAARLESLHVGGLVQGDFPRHSRRHWLTRLKAAEDAQAFYKLMLSSARLVQLYYPETDHEGKLNLPATVIPPAQRRSIPPQRRTLGWRRQLPEAGLACPKVLSEIRERILAEGLSVSQLNLYARCPFRFFCAFVLNLDPFEEETLELTALDEGRLVHRVLQKFWENHQQRPPAIPDGQREVEKLLRQEYEAEGRLVSSRMLRDMRRFVRCDLELVYQGWRPTYLEQRFRGLMIPVDGVQVELRGVIDRIDVASDGSYVLYDYKTGSVPTPKDVRTGADVQIAAYLLAAQKLLPEAENVGVGYYHISTAKRVGIFREDWVGPLLLQRGPNSLDAEAFGEQLQFFEQTISSMLQRILAGDFPAEPSSSRNCRYCPYRGISRREVGTR